MSILSVATSAQSVDEAAGPRPWRRALVVLGAMLGLFAGFNGLYFATLPFFLVPIAQEFGWGRADVSAAAVLSMLGVTLASPFVGRLFDRFGAERVIAVSVALLSGLLWGIGRLPPERWMLGALSFAIGVCGAATTMAGYLTVLPRWFDRRLGLALGVAGVGLGLGVALNGLLGATLIQRLGWRDAYAALAVVAGVSGALAVMLLVPRGVAWRAAQATTPDGRATVPSASSFNGVAASEGLSLREALHTGRFWLLVLTTFAVPMAILGTAVHAPALYADRGMTPQQAALGAGLAGMGAMLARVITGALLDRLFAPHIALVVLMLGSTGLLIGSFASSLPALVAGSLLCGVAIGAEGDLLPYFVRRYFGLEAFGAIFGSIFASYALGGVVGPVLYGLAFDRFATYQGVMQWTALACAASALMLLALGPYRYAAVDLRKPS